MKVVVGSITNPAPGTVQVDGLRFEGLNKADSVTAFFNDLQNALADGKLDLSEDLMLAFDLARFH